MNRETSRLRTIFFHNVNIFVGNGETIQGGAVLVKNGKIAQVFRKPLDETKSLNADVVEEAGKTMMPGWWICMCISARRRSFQDRSSMRIQRGAGAPLGGIF